MEGRFWNYFNWGILVVVTVVAVFLVWDSVGGGGVYVGGDVKEEVAACVDVSSQEMFTYQACFDAYLETIFLKVSRGKAEYNVDSMSVYFVDLSSKAFDLEDVPFSGESRAYKISAQKNPGSLDLELDVRGVPEGNCGPKTVFVDYCPTVGNGQGSGVISPIEGVGVSDFIEVEDIPDFNSDVVVLDLAQKEAVWEVVCKSDWDCGDWEACETGVQRRGCTDKNNCPVPTASPITARNCDGSCIERWECEWGSCRDGFSVPTCSDLNGCGTKYDLPEKLACEDASTCVPDVSCSEWTDCEVDYDFMDLVGGERVANLNGMKSRVCVDDNSCILPKKEEVSCSVSVDVYTKRFERCGTTHIGVYNVLDDSTLAILREDSDNAYLNIYFDDQDGVYCDYCFDGKRNGDEEGIDCGGSCRKCSTPAIAARRWWEKLF